jgi:hypothetical protein
MADDMFTAQVLAEDLARISSSLACECVEIRHTQSGVYVESAKLDIKKMRDVLNQIEGIIEDEDESNV